LVLSSLGPMAVAHRSACCWARPAARSYAIARAQSRWCDGTSSPATLRLRRRCSPGTLGRAARRGEYPCPTVASEAALKNRVIPVGAGTGDSRTARTAGAGGAGAEPDTVLEALGTS